MRNLFGSYDVKTFAYDFEYGSCDNGNYHSYNRNHLKVQEINFSIKKTAENFGQ